MVGDRGLLALAVVIPVNHLIVLQEARGQVLGEGHVEVGIEILLVAPALEAFLLPAAQQRVVHHAAGAGPVVGRGVTLIVTQEARNIGVDALGGAASVVDLGSPVAPSGVVLALLRELRGEAPAQRVDLLGNAAGLPGVLVPYIQVDEVHVVLAAGGVLTQLVHGSGLSAGLCRIAHVLALLEVLVGEVGAVDAVIELHKAIPAGVGAQVPQFVDDDGLVHPAPAVTLALDHALVEGLGLGVGLLRVDVHAHLGVVFMRDLDELAEVLGAAFLGGNVGILGVGRVVALVAVTLEHDRLRQTIGGQRELLDVIGRLHVGVGDLGAEVHDDTGADQVLDVLRAVGHMQARAQSDSAVVPVHGLVAVGVTGGNRYLGPRQLAGGIGLHIAVLSQVVLSLVVAMLIVEHAAGKAHGVQAGVERHTAILLGLGVGEHAGGKILAGQEAVHESLGRVRLEGTVEAVKAVARLINDGGHLRAGKALATVHRVERKQVHARHIDALDGTGAIVLLDLLDLPGERGALDLELDCKVCVHIGHAVLRAHFEHVGCGVALDRGRRHLGRDALAVELEGAHARLFAAEELAISRTALELIAHGLRERRGNQDAHLIGFDLLAIRQVGLDLGLQHEVGDVLILVGLVLDVDIHALGLIAGSKGAQGLLAHLDIGEGEVAGSIGLCNLIAHADGCALQRLAAVFGLYGAGDVGKVHVADGHFLAIALRGPAPLVLHDVLVADLGVGELKAGPVVDLNAELALAGILQQEIASILVGQGLLGIVDGKGYLFALNRNLNVHLLALDRRGELATEARPAFLFTVDLVLQVPLAAAVVAYIAEVVVVLVRQEEAKVDVIGRRREAQVNDVGVLRGARIVQQQGRRLYAGIAVAVAAAVVVTAGDLNPLATGVVVLGSYPGLALHVIAVGGPLGKVGDVLVAHTDIGE